MEIAWWGVSEPAHQHHRERDIRDDRDSRHSPPAAGYLNGVQANGQGGPRIMQFGLRYEF